MSNQKVGYKRPPRNTQFEPGKSGNPAGRPKGTRNLATDLAEVSSKRISVVENGKKRQISRQEAMLLTLFNKALQGDVRAANSIISMLTRLPSAADLTPQAKISETDQIIVENFLRRYGCDPKGEQS